MHPKRKGVRSGERVDPEKGGKNVHVERNIPEWEGAGFSKRADFQNYCGELVSETAR